MKTPKINLPETEMPANEFIRLFEAVLTKEADEDADEAIERLKARTKEIQETQQKYGLGETSNN